MLRFLTMHHMLIIRSQLSPKGKKLKHNPLTILDLTLVNRLLLPSPFNITSKGYKIYFLLFIGVFCVYYAFFLNGIKQNTEKIKIKFAVFIWYQYSTIYGWLYCARDRRRILFSFFSSAQTFQQLVGFFSKSKLKLNNKKYI